ncbi:MAG TPA: EAL domain-containing protein [Burkholderiaceae bacterium]|jgi:diguanylate cyclase (GGDEF)-like protein
MDAIPKPVKAVEPPTADGARASLQTPPGQPQISATRVKQVLLVSMAVMLMSGAGSLFNGQWLDALVVELASAALLFGWWLAHRGRTTGATALLLSTLTAMLSALVWRNGGIHDSAMLAFPALLMFASILGRRDLLLRLCLFMGTVVVALVLSNVLGWHKNVVTTAGLYDMVDPLCILAATAGVAWMMAADLHRALRSAQQENARVKESQKEIEYIATHDALTGLANRILARDLLDHVIANAQRHRTKAGLLYLDLDDFKTVNDSMGHSAGDELLQKVATRLAGALRSSDTVCRLGGDEFLVILGELGEPGDAAMAAQTVLEQFAMPFVIDGFNFSSGCSIGIAVFPQDGLDFDTLLKNADTAMYRAKDEGRNAFRFFDAAMNASIFEHARLANAMRNALARGEFSVHYQPQLDLGEMRIIGAEALLRWHHPELGSVTPARFIPIAERTGLIVPIGAWVLAEACRQATRWAAAGLDELVISVNVSSVQFQRGDIDLAVVDALHDSGLRPNLLELEITESLLVHDTEELSEAIHKLRAMGVCLAIDDFGTGYSNLSYLKRFEVERLKIDQSFVRRLHDNPHDEAIVRAIVQMGLSLGLKVIAEGIEDSQTLQMLIALGCPEGQGFLWSRPVPPDEFLSFALAHRSLQSAPAAAVTPHR